MYRYVLAGLLALALMETAAACRRKPARTQNIEVDCPPGKVTYWHESDKLCFDKCPSCPNCHEDIVMRTSVTASPVRSQKMESVDNCNNGWCSSKTQCECNPGFNSVNGRCLPPPPPPTKPSGYEKLEPRMGT